MAYHSSPQMMQTDDAQKSLVSLSSAHMPMGVPMGVPEEKKKKNQSKGTDGIPAKDPTKV